MYMSGKMEHYVKVQIKFESREKIAIMIKP